MIFFLVNNYSYTFLRATVFAFGASIASSPSSSLFSTTVSAVLFTAGALEGAVFLAGADLVMIFEGGGSSSASSALTTSTSTSSS
jgi:hypothetical protein